MKTSARNNFKGKVVSVKSGDVNAQVSVDIGGGNIVTSVITMDSVNNLGVKEGAEVHVIIKASSVMLGVE